MTFAKLVVAALAVGSVLAAPAAQARPAPELCPVSPLLDNLGIMRWDATLDDQPNGSLVTCTYRANKDIDIGGQDIAFTPACPAGKRLVFPGYNLNGTSRSELRIIGLVPKSVSSGVDEVDIVVYGPTGTRKLDLNVYALCR